MAGSASRSNYELPKNGWEISGYVCLVARNNLFVVWEPFSASTSASASPPPPRPRSGCSRGGSTDADVDADVDADANADVDAEKGSQTTNKLFRATRQTYPEISQPFLGNS